MGGMVWGKKPMYYLQSLNLIVEKYVFVLSLALGAVPIRWN